MTLSADTIWSFRSPYSYLATRRYAALTQQYDFEIALWWLQQDGREKRK